MPRFYSVQSQSDAARLRAGGDPWPTEWQRANLGPGFYAWDNPTDAENYRQVLEQHGISELTIVVYEIDDKELAALRTLDLTRLTDAEVNAWMDQYSHYGKAEPHDWERIIRNTDKATEHYFAPVSFPRFREVP
jgi:hypothetical protein